MRLSDLVRGQAPGASADQPVGQPESAPGSSLVQRQAIACADWYALALDDMARVEAAVRANDCVALDRCQELVRALVTLLAASDDLIHRALVGDVADYQVANAVHVAILSVKIGQGLHYDAAALERLALAGLLHDLGMWLVPQGIVEKPGALTEAEWSGIHAHPEQGRRLVAGRGESFQWLAATIAQEHERWDGHGYPCRLKGEAISEMAQIIGLADVFDAMITLRPYHARVVPHQALRALLVQHKQAFQPRLIKTFVDQLSLYPIGTAVRLNDGYVGVVLKVNSRYPLRPTLFVHCTREGQVVGEGALVDLSQETARHIVEVLPETRLA